MHIVKFDQAPRDEETGSATLVPREITETIEVGLVRLSSGSSHPLGCHDDEEEVYVVLEGKGRLRLGDQEHEVEAGTAVYVPRNVPHQMTCLSGEELAYVYFANWPGSKPEVSV